ncbi:tRNA lysidine(34) synthetase TilS [Flexivirga caeni]|uniref:tRNA(Ile)-lysidine synthase n=1 Tax=Flexivirga caeni TaxID=2294115 RepID=A0A3M9M7Z5_9MICO|nr:tRNA lysidine(34) synthetase TilS [Flexivirga caeni]RNI21700.1 tRNA lysidine(34) synthetase TilS [Flexivirga caeni]
MTGPHPAVAACRRHVRTCLSDLPESTVLVACSGGADSLALAAAVAFEAPKLGLATVAVVVDHRLQEGSAAIAQRAAAQCRALGIGRAEVRAVDVSGAGGPEAAARDARYAALRESASAYGAAVVLLGHTRDDQAETVLLALTRGSGPRAVTGMAAVTDASGVRWVRPLLDVTRAETHAACAALGVEPWHDPHNDDPRYLRVRMRRALADLETDVGPGVVAGLARTAELVRDDLDFLDEWALRLADALGESPWPVSELAALATPIRTRVWRELLRHAGVPAAALSKVHIDAVDALITGWHGQRPVHVPGGLQVRRGGGLVVAEPRRVE